MTCRETREYLFAFLDNELDAPLSIELQRHLERCPECAREAEIERTVGKKLADRFEADAGPTAPFDESWLSRPSGQAEPGTTPGSAHPPRRLPWGRMGAVAAALVMTVTGGLYWRGLDRVGERSDVSRFAELAVADFVHFLEQGQPVQIASDDRRQVAGWLHGKTGVPVELPKPGDPKCKLVGGRKCKIDGRPAAFAVYEMNGLPASLLVVPGDTADLGDRVAGGGRATGGLDEERWVEHCRGYTVVARQRGDLVYAAVSTLGEDDLLCLLAGAVHESD